MSALLWFLVWAILIFLMMRFGCGAHVTGHGGGRKRKSGDSELRWVPPETDVDPVCGKKIKTANAKPTVFDGQVYYFCSRDCRERFEAAPELYMGDNPPAAPRQLENADG